MGDRHRGRRAEGAHYGEQGFPVVREQGFPVVFAACRYLITSMT